MTAQRKLRALITGASRGIGRATAEAFAASNIDLVLVSRSQAQLDELAQTLQEQGVEVRGVAINLSEVGQVKSQISQLLDQVGSIDILINNAGMGYTGELIDMPLADWQRVLGLNVTSVFECVQAVLPGMRSQQQGTIINIVSIAGQQAFPQWGAYCASKFALMGFTKSLAQEERPHGIRVTAVCPGAVNTPLWDTDTVDADFDRSAMLRPENVAQSILHIVQMPQNAVIEELVLMPNAGTF
ncbi:SDR family oxidoreductase [Acaryochloris marina]|uniref:3-oxoacyl-[acyl-carrier-protein] reductase n=1 Tax=Acaryochloris marina (strain MBIC 11017) TaxID=329726 RepID=B0CF68_ACAM1|nr:SDR family oxidoreductase [Acaryochloris marina]ABW30584.1 3-oxoacyl-[acyl-carrier-protein] reductase [Acaryochloris marina MBIC11017]BDM79382.1 short-chain dehydrogenase [Acaryochloris marina MBIC10699]